jgi:hypothetical protein
LFDANQDPFAAYNAAAAAAPVAAAPAAPAAPANTDRRKEEDAAMLRERAAEIAREERLAKIAYMENMPDATPAGTGELSLSHCTVLVALVLVCCQLYATIATQ